MTNSVRARSGSRSRQACDIWRRAASVVLASLTTIAALAATVSYQYDELGRLRKVIYEDGKVTEYALDPAGNRTAVNTAVASMLQFSAATFSVGDAWSMATIT